MEMQIHRITYYEDENFYFSLQPINEVMFMHCEVKNWKPSVLKKMYEVFNTLKTEAKNNGYEKLSTISPNPKFAKLFGGVTIMDITHLGVDCEVVVWEL